jgi:serine/threonine protein kinase/tetratricopeptide (TPR) repeat protein
MIPERWQRLEDLFHAMLELPADSRAAALAAACGDDSELRVELERLLQSHAQASAFVSGAAAGVESVAALVVPEGAQVGAYRIIRELGRGGMGTVYLGERADAQFEMRVAIKLIKRGMDTDAVLQRFRHERQILAGLEHPNIARLLDGGTTGDGLPYFVMEHVDGEPIDEYCRTHEVSIDQRLRLFRQVCAAMSYAHQHLVVHRDIKPSNILVTADGVPKLVDFGIAKLLDPGENASPLATELGAQAMTPQYASPEQLRGERVTTVSDVYALGVLLYELLAGARPYDVTGKTPAESKLIVVDSEVARPSVTAARRGDDVLSRRLRGDLDSIVITAIRKDPAERYGSVALLDDDIRRHMEQLPVVARGDSWTYRAARFVRRRKLGVAAAAAIGVTLIGGVIATSWQARVARAERTRAERRFNDVRKLANSVLFDYHDAIEALPGSTPVRERLVKDAQAYLDSLAAEASGDPTLQRELAAAYDRLGTVLGRPGAANLGDTAGAMQSYRKALQIREAIAAADPRSSQARRELAESHRRIGWQLTGTPEFDASREHFRQAIAIYTQLVTEQPGDTESRVGLASAHSQLGGILGGRNDLAGALENQRRALALLEAAPAETRGTPEFRRRLSITHENIGTSLFLSGDDAAGLEANAKALALRAALANEDPTNAIFRRMLAISYQNDGDYRDHAGDSDGALSSFRRKLAIDEELIAADPANAQAGGDLGYTLVRLGDILAKRGGHAEALLHYRRSAEQWEKLRKPSGDTTLNPILAVSYAGVARAQANLGNQSAALDAARRAETVVATGPDDVMNSGQRELRAQTFEYVAEAHVALATRHGISPADAKAHWSAACRTLQQSGEVWADMRRRGILWGTDASKPETLARKIEDCKAKLDGT